MPHTAIAWEYLPPEWGLPLGDNLLMKSTFTKEQSGICPECYATRTGWHRSRASPHPSASPRPPAPSIPPCAAVLTDPSGRTVVVTVHQE